MGKSLTFRGAVFEAQELIKNHRCRDPLCDTHLWKIKHELDMSRLRVRQLERAMDSHGLKPPQIRQVLPRLDLVIDIMLMLLFLSQIIVNVKSSR